MKWKLTTRATSNKWCEGNKQEKKNKMEIVINGPEKIKWRRNKKVNRNSEKKRKRKSEKSSFYSETKLSMSIKAIGDIFLALLSLSIHFIFIWFLSWLLLLPFTISKRFHFFRCILAISFGQKFIHGESTRVSSECKRKMAKKRKQK